MPSDIPPVKQQEIKDDIEKQQFPKLWIDIEDYLKSNPTQKNAGNDFTAMLQGILPDITIVNYDDSTTDGNGLGIRIKDTNKNDEDTYTLDPTTGIARDEKGLIQAIYYPNGTIQRFQYDANENLIQVLDASGTVWKQGEDKQWHAYDGKTGEPIMVNGEPLVSKASFTVDQDTGAIRIKNENGTYEEHFPDGSAVFYTSDKKEQETGRISAFDPTRDPTHHRTRQTFNNDKTVVTMGFPDQPDKPPRTYVKRSDGLWMCDGHAYTGIWENGMLVFYAAPAPPPSQPVPGPGQDY